MKLRFGSVLLWVLLGSSIGLECDWELSPERDLNQDQDLGEVRLDPVLDTPDLDRCRAACCVRADCDAAVLGFPQDGPTQCLMARCRTGGCSLASSDQMKVYLKREVRDQDQNQDPDPDPEQHVVPLLEAPEPKTNETNNTRCRLQMKVGSCRAAFRKFFYNVTSESCQIFVYGGCHGNGNNFHTQEECEVTCSGVTGSVLLDESSLFPMKATRMVPAHISADETQGADEKSETLTAQSGHTPETEMSPEDFAERCEVEPEAGLCRAAFQHWYYNLKTGSCQSFIYGGCGGNKNNYLSKRSCMDTCSGGSVLRRASRNRWTAAVFLFITLAAMSALLLATLIIVTMRRRGLARRPSSVSDKDELLPDSSSVDSLTVPELDRA